MPLYALGDSEPSIDSSCFIHPDAVIIGNVTIGAMSSVWPGAVLRGDNGSITVGERTSIQDGSVIHTTPHLPTVIGDDVTIGHNVHLEGCTIHDRSLVGSGAVVLHAAEVGPEGLVGAAALVGNHKIVPPNARALGVPAAITEGVAKYEQWSLGVDVYVDRAQYYRTALRRID